jgi:hypothetical protein
MGSGVSYNVVTITAVKDGAAWERMALRFQRGDLHGWVREVDTLRHDAAGKLLLPLHWSPLQEVDFRSIPTDGREHALSLYMEDTMWPYREQYLRYIDTSGAVYSKSLQVADPFINRSGVPARARQPGAARGRADAEDREDESSARAVDA